MKVENVPVSGPRREIYSMASDKLPPGASWTFTLSGQVLDVCAATQVSTTPYGYQGCVGVAGAPTGNLVMPRAFTVGAQQSPAVLSVGDTIVYPLELTNTGSATLTGGQ